MSKSSIIGLLIIMSLLFSIGYAYYNKVNVTPPIQDYLSAFHNGVVYSDLQYPVWNTTYNRNVLSFATTQIDYPLNTIINNDGSLQGSYGGGSTGIKGLIDYCVNCFNKNLVPFFETVRIDNFESLTQSIITNFFTKIQTFLISYPDKFIIWSPACEFNHPDGDNGWNNWKIDYRDYNRIMPIIRQTRDNMNLQNKIFLCVHANLKGQNPSRSYAGITEYISGFSQSDIIGMSLYYGYRNSIYNEAGETWQVAVDQAWARSKIILDKITSFCGKQLPFYFVEYSHGSVWRNEQTWMDINDINYVYQVKLPNNLWVKGLCWYVGNYMTDEGSQCIV